MSKELEALHTIAFNTQINGMNFGDELRTIEQALLKAQEQEKVLEIIEEKKVDIGLLKRSENWLDYYTRVKHKIGKDTELTEEEFDLLKRIFTIRKGDGE